MEINNNTLYDKQICVIGMGYVGLTLALTFSDLGFKVIGVEKREKVINSLTQGRAHFFEAGLNQILKRELGKSFKFLTNLEESLSDIYIVAVGTPADFGRKPDFSGLKEVSQQIGKVLKKDDLIILRSTVSPGTTRSFVIPLLEQESGLRAGTDFYVSFAPERTIEGDALNELKTLPQVIGGINSKSALYTADFFNKITLQTILVNSLEAAEMVKLANNLCRDVNFGFANELALICDKFNLDANEVIEAANSGYPRNKIASPSPGVGGYCLTKDPYILADAVEKKGYSPKLILSA
ncbi:nucleotide sugar dehydrogenase, partial [Patescibacteria group bacterium]